MKQCFYFYLLIASLSVSSALGQTTSDANLLQKDIADILCGGTTNEVLVPTNATDAMKRIAALDFAYQLAKEKSKGSILKNEIYPKIIPKLTAAAASGAGGWMTFYSESGKALLFSAIGCSPIDKFVKYVDGSIETKTTNDYSEWSTKQPYQSNENCSMSNGNTFGFYLKNDECTRICEPGSHYIEEANKVNGKFVPGFHDVNSGNDQTTYSGCVRCDDPDFGGDTRHTITDDQSNGCYDMDDCEIGYAKREMRLAERPPNSTSESLWDYKNHDSLPQFSLDDQYINIRSLQDASQYKVGTFLKKVCAEKCKDWQEIDENGNCASTFKNTCRTLKNYYDQLSSWDPQVILNMSPITSCSSVDLYDFMKQQKTAYLAKMKITVMGCRNPSQDNFDAANNAVIDFAELTISNLMYFETYGQSPCESTQIDQDDKNTQRASDEDFYTIRRPLLDILK